MKNDLPVLCIIGPTSSGKTDLSIALSEYFDIEIVNVDSAQVYRQMDIGTGKVSQEIRERVAHHLIDIIDPCEIYNVAQFCEDASACISKIHNRGKIPVLVGGTMMYFKALQQGLSPLPQASQRIRQTISDKALAHGWEALYQQLVEIDPLSAAKIKPNDKQRLQRALEVFEMTQKPLSYWQSLQSTHLSCYRYINIGLIPLETPRSHLHERIETRFDNMISQGFIDEVNALYQRGDLDAHLPAIRTVGYRQIWQYLNNEIDDVLMREKSVAATRQLAKRQLTWLRHWSDLIEFDYADPNLLLKVTEKIQLIL